MMIVTGMIMIMIMMIKIIAVVILVTITNMMMITIICDYDYDDNNSDHENNEYDNDNRAQRNLMIIIMIKKCTALMYVSIYIYPSLCWERGVLAQLQNAPIHPMWLAGSQISSRRYEQFMPTGPLKGQIVLHPVGDRPTGWLHALGACVAAK